MGWNTTVLLAKGKKLADMKRVIPDVFAVTERTIFWEDALTGVDIASIDTWTGLKFAVATLDI